MSEAELLIGRLVNWKFASATEYLDASPNYGTTSVIRGLSESFGNSGYFGGMMGEVVAYTVANLCGEISNAVKTED